MRLGIRLPWEEGGPRDLQDDQRPLTMDRPRRRFCPHNRTRLDPSARRVFCRDCGEEVDAFTILAGIAEDHERLVMHREHLRDKIAVLEQHVESLQRTRRSLTGQIKRRTKT